MRRRMTRGNVALAVLAVLAVVLGVLAIQKQNAPPPVTALGVSPAAPGATSDAARTPMPVAFVADGWTSGTPRGGQGPANYTAVLAGSENWRVSNPAVYGAGYVAGRTLDSQVPEVVDARPQLVVVSGGRADAESDPAAVRDAATRLYRDLRTRLPQTPIVVIGPMWLGNDPPPQMSAVRDAVRDAATDVELPFVDPIEARWFIGRDADGITPDGADLTDRGHQRLAELVGEALRRAGASPR